MNLPQSIPFGRMDDIRKRPDADRIAYWEPGGVFSDYRLKKYASRDAMKPFLKGSHHALVKDRVESSMIINRNLQRPI